MLFVALSAQPAHAHVDVRPTLIEQGALTELRVELPPLRPGPRPRRLELEAPGVEVLAVRMQEPRGVETVWTVRLRADGAPGETPLVLRAVYADGRSVEVDQSLTVVPAPEGSGFPWPAVVVGSLLALGLAALGLLVARRKA